MRKSSTLLLAIAAAALPLAAAPAALADGGTTYQATMDQINNSGGSGMFTIQVKGDQATIKGHVSGLATTFMGGPYPHAEHIHADGKGTCPGPSADANGDGIVDTVEGQPAYGKVATSLTTSGDSSPKSAVAVKRFPSGGAYDYNRTITLDSTTMTALKSGNAVIVVHGLDPANLSKKAQNAKSNLDPALPLAATAPALCGVLSASPVGGPNTGSGSAAGGPELGLAAGGGALVLLGGGALLWSRRRVQDHG
ncbi:MAG: hypothetical protein ABIZ07_02420 [Dermatophilaceae bacterium]